MAGADPFAIMKAMGHADIKTTMIHGSLGRSHIRDQVERLNAVAIPKSAYAPTQHLYRAVTGRRFPSSVAIFRFPLPQNRWTKMGPNRRFL